MRIPLLLADSIHGRACRPKCEKFLTRPDKKIAPIGAEQYHFAVIHSHYRGGFILEIMFWTA